MIRLVMSREIRQRVRSRGFKITTILLCLGVLGAGVLSRTISGNNSPTRYDVAVVGPTPEGFTAAVRNAAQLSNVEVRIIAESTAVAAEQALESGHLDAYIDIGAATVVAKSKPTEQLAAILAAGWQSSASLSAAGIARLDDAQIAKVLSPAPLHLWLLHPDSSHNDNVSRLVGSATAVLLFISINAFGGLVLTGVVEEKTTGVVEVLLAHVRAYQLLAGKVFGIGVVAMLQFSATVLTGVIALRISGTSVPGALWIGLPTTVLWFVGGFVLYSTLFALLSCTGLRVSEAIRLRYTDLTSDDC